MALLLSSQITAHIIMRITHFKRLEYMWYLALEWTQCHLYLMIQKKAQQPAGPWLCCLGGYRIHWPFVLVLVLSRFICVRPCNPMDCNPPGSMSMGFSRQEYWSGLFMPSSRGSWPPALSVLFLVSSQISKPLQILLSVLFL